MTRIEHANLVVKDIDASLSFLQTALPDWQVRGQGQMNWRGHPRRWLHFGSDDDYITLNDGAVGENRELDGLTPGLAHIGIVVDDLNSVQQRLEAAGYPVDIEGAAHPHRRNLYFLDPAGFQFEFVEYLSAHASEKNLYGGEIGRPTRNPKSIGKD